MIHEQWLQLKMKFLLGYNLKIIFYWGKINLWWHGMEKYLDRRESNGGMRSVCVCVWGGEHIFVGWGGGDSSPIIPGWKTLSVVPKSSMLVVPVGHQRKILQNIYFIWIKESKNKKYQVWVACGKFISLH